MKREVFESRIAISPSGLSTTYVKAEPVGMMCEHPGCLSHDGKDYKRKGEVGEWADEPIFLCSEHSIGFEEL